MQLYEKEKLSSQQQNFLTKFIFDFNQQTCKSKNWMEKYHQYHVDNTNVENYFPLLKETQYPIVIEKSLGVNLWDIDGNEYIDLSMGSGAHLLGHNPPFVTEAIKKQLKQGMQLGPQFYATGKLAKLIAEMTQFERIFFSNTATEAIMSVARITRACTERLKIVIFADAFYGHYDGFHAKQQEDQAISRVLGTPNSMVQDVIVLEYGSQSSLEILESQGQEIAGVFVEPFQRNNMSLKPSDDYIQKLCRIAKECGAALVFNELTTGFRFQQRGASSYFNVTPDIAIYGQCIANGMPMSIIAGNAKFMDMIDGGAWSFGDNSHPKVKMTAVAGTFCKHPLAIVAGIEVLEYLKKQGASLQNNLNKHTKNFVDRLELYFSKEKLPFCVEYFGSFFRLQSKEGTKNSHFELELLFRLLLKNKVFTAGNRICSLSTVHNEKHLDFVFEKIEESISTLRSSGFLH